MPSTAKNRDGRKLGIAQLRFAVARSARRLDKRFSRAFLIWTAVIALLGSVNAFDLGDYFLTDLGNYASEKPASGKIMVIGIEQSNNAKTQKTLQKLLPKFQNRNVSIYLVGDVRDLSWTSTVVQFKQRNAWAQDRLYLPSHFDPDNSSNIISPQGIEKQETRLSQPVIRDFMFYRQMHRGVEVEKQYIPSIAESISGKQVGKTHQPILIDYAFSTDSIPTRILQNERDAEALKIPEKIQNVIIDINDSQNFEQHVLPLRARTAIVGKAHAYAAETLMAGEPVRFGFWIVFVFSIGCVFLYELLRSKLPSRKNVALILQWASFGVFFSAGLYGYYFDILPSVVFAAVWTYLAIRGNHLEEIIETATYSGLPNFKHLAKIEDAVPKALIAIKVTHWNELLLISNQIRLGELAQNIADRLRHGNEGQIVWHNDDSFFAIMLPVKSHELDNNLLGLRALFATPFQFMDDRVDINLIFGIDTNEGVSLSKRLSAACAAADEAAMSTADQSTASMKDNEDVQFSLSLHANIDDALDNNEIWVAYQPKLDLKSGMITSGEALLRWTHPQRGPISPAEFVLEAEKTGRMEKLTELVLKSSAEVIKDLQPTIPEINISVNLSTAILDKSSFLPWLQGIVSTHKIDPRTITFEVTETRKAASVEQVISQLLNLKAMGFRLSLDDFGTGAANFELLVRLPVDEIKIDYVFVRQMQFSAAHRAVVQACSDYAIRIGLDLVAEGVEDEAILSQIRNMNCSHAQGYHISKGVNYKEFELLIYETMRNCKFG